MKPYSSRNHFTYRGVAILLLGSIIFGALVGVSAFLVSNLIYFIVLFSIGVGAIAMLVYYRLMLLARVRLLPLTIGAGILLGFIAVFAFNFMPYQVLRREYIAQAAQIDRLEEAAASQAFDGQLAHLTGQGGFIGYLLLRARQGEGYTNYILAGGIPIHEFHFTFKGMWAWLYWFLEALIIMFLPGWIGYDAGKRPFNLSANNWYEPVPTQIGSVALSDKEWFLKFLRIPSVQEAGKLIVAEGAIDHPRVEIYQQRCKPAKGDILLSIKETRRASPTKVQRTTLEQWELSIKELQQLTNQG